MEEDDVLRLHSGMNPAVLGPLLGRTPEAVARRLRRLQSYDGQRRSPHYTVTRRNGITPGERGAIAREMTVGGPRRYLALATRLELPPAKVLAAAGAASDVPRRSPRAENRKLYSDEDACA